MIVVTGATGKVGSEAVRLLRQQDVPVRAMVRDLEKGRPLATAGAELARADLDDPNAIDQALAGADTVILVSPGVPAQELNVVASAVRQGVKHVVKVTSNASTDSPIARRRHQAEIEAGLAASGLAHMLLRANAFMQNTLALAPAIKRTGGFGSSAGAGRVGMVDARDVAAAAAEVAVTPQAHAGRTYWLTGPALISYADVAATLAEVVGRLVQFRTLSFEEDRTAMVQAGLPAPVAEMNAQAFSLIAEGDAAWLSPDLPALLDRPARSFARFAADFALAFG
ncbi:MAG TPA: NmrA family NAD(P)-binding protein [Streptosporangiaceae bacterium]|jgi:uncharacterized protein YbjT (DUF2867 family)